MLAWDDPCSCPMALHPMHQVLQLIIFLGLSAAQHGIALVQAASHVESHDVTLLYAARRSPRCLAKRGAVPPDAVRCDVLPLDTPRLAPDAAHYIVCDIARCRVTRCSTMPRNVAHTIALHADKRLLRGMLRVMAHIQMWCQVMARAVPRIEGRCSTQCRV
jgi:hypothetical protein